MTAKQYLQFFFIYAGVLVITPIIDHYMGVKIDFDNAELKAFGFATIFTVMTKLNEMSEKPK